MTGRFRVGVIGVGRAGRARVEALRARQDVDLVGAHRGRYLDDLGVRAFPDLQQLVDAVDVVFVCSPSALHGEHVRLALRSGRHAVVEFPVARDRVEAEGLFFLARSAGRVLHVEHIELLSPTTAFLTRPGVGRDRGRVRFTSGHAALDGPTLAWQQVARVHRLVALGGPVAVVEVARASGEALDADLVFVDGGTAHLSVRAGPGRRRLLHHRVSATDGVREIRGHEAFLDGRPVPLARGALFADDTDRALARVRSGGPSYVSEARVLHVLDVCAALGNPGRARLSVKAG